MQPPAPAPAKYTNLHGIDTGGKDWYSTAGQLSTCTDGREGWVAGCGDEAATPFKLVMPGYEKIHFFQLTTKNVGRVLDIEYKSKYASDKQYISALDVDVANNRVALSFNGPRELGRLAMVVDATSGATVGTYEKVSMMDRFRRVKIVKNATALALVTQDSPSIVLLDYQQLTPIGNWDTQGASQNAVERIVHHRTNPEIVYMNYYRDSTINMVDFRMEKVAGRLLGLPDDCLHLAGSPHMCQHNGQDLIVGTAAHHVAIWEPRAPTAPIWELKDLPSCTFRAATVRHNLLAVLGADQKRKTHGYDLEFHLLDAPPTANRSAIPFTNTSGDYNNYWYGVYCAEDAWLGVANGVVESAPLTKAAAPVAQMTQQMGQMNMGAPTGAYPPGAYPPGAYPPGAYPPGAYPPSAYPGAYPQPTGYPAGYAQPQYYAPPAGHAAAPPAGKKDKKDKDKKDKDKSGKKDKKDDKKKK